MTGVVFTLLIVRPINTYLSWQFYLMIISSCNIYWLQTYLLGVHVQASLKSVIISGLIKAIQLDYTEAHKHLMNAIRKAPQHVAIGFKQHVSCILFTKSVLYISLNFLCNGKSYIFSYTGICLALLYIINWQG